MVNEISTVYTILYTGRAPGIYTYGIKLDRINAFVVTERQENHRHKQLNLEKMMVYIWSRMIRICRKEFHKTKADRKDAMHTDNSRRLDARTYLDKSSLVTACGNCM